MCIKKKKPSTVYCPYESNEHVTSLVACNGFLLTESQHANSCCYYLFALAKGILLSHAIIVGWKIVMQKRGTVINKSVIIMTRYCQLTLT